MNRKINFNAVIKETKVSSVETSVVHVDVPYKVVNVDVFIIQPRIIQK